MDIAGSGTFQSQRIAKTNLRLLQLGDGGRFNGLRPFQPRKRKLKRHIQRYAGPQHHHHQQCAGGDNGATQPVLKREVFHFIVQRQEAALAHDVTAEIDIDIRLLAEILAIQGCQWRG